MISVSNINKHCSRFHDRRFMYKTKCKKCDAEIRADTYHRHCRSFHGELVKQNDSPVKSSTPSPKTVRTKCEICGVEMNKTNISRHMKNVHGKNSFKTSKTMSETVVEESPAKRARIDTNGSGETGKTGPDVQSCAFDDERATMKSITLKTPHGRYICPVESCEQVIARLQTVL